MLVSVLMDGGSLQGELCKFPKGVCVLLAGFNYSHTHLIHLAPNIYLNVVLVKTHGFKWQQ